MFEDQDGINNDNIDENIADTSSDSPIKEPTPSVEDIPEEIPMPTPTPSIEPTPVPTIEPDPALFEGLNTEPEQNENVEESPVTVQPVRFASFDEEENVQGNENRNLDLLMNVNLQMSVELGRTELPFKKVLELTRGSIISLDKLAGEPVELFANGKLVAFGEVVVIEDNFGLRITSIAAPEERLKTVHEGKENK